MCELRDPGYYMTESGNLMILYPKNSAIYSAYIYVDIYVEKLGRWHRFLYSESQLYLLNKTLEFEYLGKL
jgi:hypothetical protein